MTPTRQTTAFTRIIRMLAAIAVLSCVAFTTTAIVSAMFGSPWGTVATIGVMTTAALIVRPWRPRPTTEQELTHE